MKHAKTYLALLLALIVASLACFAALAEGANEATPGEPDRCEHENATITVTKENVKYKSVDSRSHIVGYDEVTTIDCPDCGGDVVTVYKQYSEAHTMKDGVCELCGYKQSKAPAKTSKPTATPAATATPTPEPTAEPTATPVPQMPEMARMLLDALTLVQFEGEDVTVEIVGARQMFTQDEFAALCELPVHEQLLLTLSAAGMADVAESAIAALDEEFSEEAQKLDAQIVERMLNLTEEEQEALNETLDTYFPLGEVEEDGVSYPLFTIELLISVDGEARVQRYSFIKGEDDEWNFHEYAVQAVEAEG